MSIRGLLDRWLRAREREDRIRSRPGLRSVVAQGFVGGLVATAVMTVYRLPVFRALPPTAEFVARYVTGGRAEDYPVEGFLLHFLYGGAAGGVFGALFAPIAARTSVARERVGIACGLGFGLVLSTIGSRVVLRRVLGRALDVDEALVFHVGHAVYGLTLGTWVGLWEPVGEVYEQPSRTGVAGFLRRLLKR